MENKILKESYYERLRELSDIKNSKKNNIGLGTLIDNIKANNGINYGIIKENHSYYIKKGGLSDNPDISDFIFINGESNSSDYKYKSLSEATKIRNMMINTINESLNIKLVKDRLVENFSDEIKKSEDKLSDLDDKTEKENNSSDLTDVNIDDIDLDNIDTNSEDTESNSDLEDTKTDTESNPDLEDTKTDTDAESNSDSEDTETNDENIKEIEKLVGKVTNLIRSNKLDNKYVKSFINSYLSAFKDKLPNIDIEDRKEMSNKILKVVSDDDIDSINIDDSNNKVNEFKHYCETMGYDSLDSIMESSDDEITNLISGYANNNTEITDDSNKIISLIVKLINPEILKSLNNDYGMNDYSSKLEPIVNGMNETTKDNDFKELNELWNNYDDNNTSNDNEDDKSNIDELDDNDIDNTESANTDNIDNTESINSDNIDDTESINTDNINDTESINNMNNQNRTDIKVKSNNGTEIEFSLNEQKLRKYISNKIKQQLNGKSIINENYKSERIKNLDMMIIDYLNKKLNK